MYQARIYGNFETHAKHHRTFRQIVGEWPVISSNRLFDNQCPFIGKQIYCCQRCERHEAH